jgi:predicted AAA+ superfamily ATPase
VLLVAITPLKLYFKGVNSPKVEYQRALKMTLPQQQSAFLWGARQVGKSSLLKKLFPNSLSFDLLEADLYFRLLKEPSQLREILLAEGIKKNLPIIIDEVQKIPALLDEVHGLIENHGFQFVLCGSSARKLKREHANLLGGRAWRYVLHPLTFKEITDFDLLKGLNRGMLPAHYQSQNYRKALNAYVQDYLREEIRAEGLARNLRAFAKFLDAAAFSNGELVNYKNLGSDCGVDAKTVKEYFQILEDTYLGYMIQPLVRKKGRKSINTIPKFYYFDTGVANFLSKTTIEELKGPQAGHSFEHFIMNELVAYRAYSEKEYAINYWRTAQGQEVGAILADNHAYIEVKITDNVKTSDLRGLEALLDEEVPKKSLVVCCEKRARLLTTNRGHKILVMPWAKFLGDLWAGKII